MTSTKVRVRNPARSRGYQTKEAVAERVKVRVSEREMLDRAERVHRDVCFGCGVPEDRHAESGCKRWRGML